MLAYLSNDGNEILEPCNSEQQPLNLNFTKEFSSSYMSSQMPPDVRNILAIEDVTMNFHRNCVTPENFARNNLDRFWKTLSLGKDLDGLSFISALESKSYPIWGSQFHPEKNPFEWTPKYPKIPHTQNAIRIANWFAQFFVQEARKNSHSFSSRQEEEKYLIYNYDQIYTGNTEWNMTFEQAYVFK